MRFIARASCIFCSLSLLTGYHSLLKTWVHSLRLDRLKFIHVWRPFRRWKPVRSDILDFQTKWVSGNLKFCCPSQFHTQSAVWVSFTHNHFIMLLTVKICTAFPIKLQWRCSNKECIKFTWPYVLSPLFTKPLVLVHVLKCQLHNKLSGLEVENLIEFLFHPTFFSDMKICKLWH